MTDNERGLQVRTVGGSVASLTGNTATIGGTEFELNGPRTLFGLAANRPSASDAHVVIPFAYYVSVDTQAVEQTDGTNWVAV